MSLVRLSIPAWTVPCGLRISADNTISNVHTDSSAQKAGCKIGDKIISVDDIAIGCRASSVSDLLSSRKAGATVIIELRRPSIQSTSVPPKVSTSKSSSNRKRKAEETASEQPKSMASKVNKKTKLTGRVTDLNALLRKLPKSEAEVLKLLKSSPGLAMQDSKDDDDLCCAKVGEGGSSVGRIWPLHIAAQWAASPRVIHALLNAWPHAAREFAWDPEGHEQCWQGGGHDGSRAALPLHLALQARRPPMKPDEILQIFNAYPEAARWRNWLRSLPLHLAVEWACRTAGGKKGAPSKEQLKVVKLIGEAFPEAVGHTDMNEATPFQTCIGAESETLQKLLKVLKGKRSKWQVGDKCDDCDRFPEESNGYGGGSDCGSCDYGSD